MSKIHALLLALALAACDAPPTTTADGEAEPERGPNGGRLLVDGDIQVDHIRPHAGDAALFFNRANLQALCLACHARKTQAGQ